MTRTYDCGIGDSAPAVVVLPAGAFSVACLVVPSSPGVAMGEVDRLKPARGVVSHPMLLYCLVAAPQRKKRYGVIKPRVQWENLLPINATKRRRVGREELVIISSSYTVRLCTAALLSVAAATTAQLYPRGEALFVFASITKKNPTSKQCTTSCVRHY